MIYVVTYEIHVSFLLKNIYVINEEMSIHLSLGRSFYNHVKTFFFLFVPFSFSIN